MGTKRKGQALMELAAGMFALALVVSVLCTFAMYIVRSLEIQNELRGAGGGERAESVEVGGFAERYFTGSEKLEIREKAKMR